MRLVALLLFLTLGLSAEQIKLYLKDGGFHMVREYTVREDRVRYYSAERGDWEEIPLALVDLKKTEDERKSAAARERKDAEIADAEEKFEREEAAEVARIPMNPGLYTIIEGRAEELKISDLKVVNNKGRNILKAMSPIPIVAGKSTVEMEGEHSTREIRDPRPFFYFRLGQFERFAIVRTKPKKGTRVVETWQIIPVTNEIVAERDEREIFRQQFRDGLYKVWPVKPLEPGDYAFIEFVEGKGEIQARDFRIVSSGR